MVEQIKYVVFNVDMYERGYLTEDARNEFENPVLGCLSMGEYRRIFINDRLAERLDFGDNAVVFPTYQTARNYARRLQRFYNKHGWEAQWKAAAVRQRVTVSYESIRNIPDAG